MCEDLLAHMRRGDWSSFGRLAGWCAIGSGVGGFLYSVAFVLISRSSAEFGASLSWALLMIGGLLTTVVMVALYERLQDQRSAAIQRVGVKCAPGLEPRATRQFKTF